MKFALFSALITILFGSVSFAAMTTDPAPYHPTLRRLIEQQDLAGPHVERVTQAIWDFSIHGGKSTTIPLGIYLPSKALITRSYMYVVTPPTQVNPPATFNAGTFINFFCEDAANIKSNTDFHSQSVGSVVEGNSTGTAASMVASIANKCQISAVISTTASASEGWVTSNNANAISSGKIRLFIHWVGVE